MPQHASYGGEIADRLDEIRAKGQKEASGHRPTSDSSHMDQHEASIQSDAEKYLASEQRLFDSVMTESSRAAVEIQQQALQLQAQIDQLVSDESLRSTVDAEMSVDRQELAIAAERRMRAEVDCRHFRAQNGITHEAVYPESHIWHFAIIALLALIETSINAFFYENAQGLLGGFTVALGVAVVNMVGALILGIGFRFKNLAAPDKKALGWLCLIAFVILSVYCNALFSAFRAEYQLLTDPTDPLQLRQAFTEATGEARKVFFLGMHFADLMSFILFGLGFLLSCISFYKGYTFDDKYPGHGDKDRSVKAAQREERAKHELLRQRVKDLLNRRRSEVQSIVHEPAQLINRAATRISELQHAQSLLGIQAQAIQRDFAMVLRAYRDANTAVRATEPPPYFRDIPDLAGRVSGAAVSQVVATLSATQEQLRQLRETHQEALNGKLNSLQEESATILNQTLTAFLRDIENEAQDNINRLTPTIHRLA